MHLRRALGLHRLLDKLLLIQRSRLLGSRLLLHLQLGRLWFIEQDIVCVGRVQWRSCDPSRYQLYGCSY
ncbi:hypothetical protein [Xanthomonas albilineans]|uniref:hypothetical protein n=1 Tax=Xanthomonas albilineans TaxID=29447 RepID=UPI0005F34AE0|nr:hypothetical protein [Xanthomonas albilineans]PPU91660.1 hypothetical protein XalbCFBP2523_13890 [Xanthomonas albilineans]